ncbi:MULTISPECIES: SDR family NAD(P)-dependent oxidoreductase [Arthrobacter]|uniref:SDR family NAD(P)-dependent oxidoreductase n=1 Tax=Arthrobacter TaxID=1663 RepID=UPI001D15018D|nr:MULTISPECIES: SDR family oxidoreductase [Arthrobacter]MCC3281995.1 SDR family oxidoreductase [Arthrobacter caoxuetaonis]MCC3282966.1 SDR family oxidoreductase [Arthrobacter caoxuetaonis]MCC9192103.1 SDR family oxidoreductase [Arthrobacter sp. zg-Y916]
MDLQLSGKTALVTGGTRGIGRAIVEAFAAEGANVAFCARDAAEVAATETALAGTGAKVEGTVLDVGDGGAVAAWVDAVAGRFGGLDAVVSNVSALAIPDSPESWEASLRVDVMGTVALMQAAIPHVERSESPSLVAISSVSGREVDFASGPYGTAKSALIGYMAGLAFQLAGTGIRANTVSPGNTYFDGGVWQGLETGAPEMFTESLALNPTGRMGTPQEVADVVVFVSSPRASRMTGANVLVDGGLSRGIQF